MTNVQYSMTKIVKTCSSVIYKKQARRIQREDVAGQVNEMVQAEQPKTVRQHD